MIVRYMYVMLFSSFLIAGCGDKTPSEADFLDVINQEYPKTVSDEDRDVSITITIEDDSAEAERYRSEAINKYGDRLNGFGYARIEGRITYKRNISKTQLRTGGSISVHAISLYLVDDNSHWQIFDEELLDVRSFPPSEEVLSEVRELERQEAARREQEAVQREEEQRTNQIRSEIRRIDSSISQTEGRLDSTYRSLEEQKQTVVSICGQFPDSLNCAGRKRRQEAIEANVAEYIAHKEALQAERVRLQGEL